MKNLKFCLLASVIMLSGNAIADEVTIESQVSSPSAADGLNDLNFDASNFEGFGDIGAGLNLQADVPATTPDASAEASAEVKPAEPIALPAEVKPEADASADGAAAK